MELRQLKYFVQTAEVLSFSKASKLLFVSQSALSQQIRQLEQELNIRLFQRDSHRVSLTEAGEELLPLARHTLQTADACFDRIHDLRNLLTGTLNIGVTYSFSPILTETLLRFMQTYPQVKLNVWYKSMEDLMDALHHRDLDFVLAFKPTTRYDDIESHILFDNCLAAIVNPRHPLARRDSVTMEELEAFDIALPATGTQARSAFEQLCARHAGQFHIRIELNEVNILIKLVKQTDLVSILAESAVRDDAGVCAVPISSPDNRMTGCVHALKNVYRKHSMREFVRMLGESNAARERTIDWI